MNMGQLIHDWDPAAFGIRNELQCVFPTDEKLTTTIKNSDYDHLWPENAVDSGQRKRKLQLYGQHSYAPYAAGNLYDKCTAVEEEGTGT